MKKTAVLCFVVSASIFAACNNSGNQESATVDSASSKMTTMESNVKESASAATTNVQEAMAKNPDSTFVAEVVVANNEEIRLLQAGIDKGTDKTLKGHAKMMIKDHKDLKKKMEDYAAAKNYPVMSSDDGDAQKKLDDLNTKSGNDWDKAWASMIVDGHEKTIGKFEGAEGQVKDEALKSMITGTLPTLKSHLAMAQDVASKLK
jgi:putative membrane protein